MTCHYCNLIETAKRVFPGYEKEPFVIVTDPKFSTPILIWRKHCRPSSEEITHAIEAMSALGKQVFGEYFYISTDVEAEHFWMKVALLKKGKEKFYG